MSKFNYFNKISVSSTTFPTVPISFGFHSQAFSFLNKGDAIVEYSFNGTDVHGDMDPDDASAGLTFDNRVECKVYFRLASASGPQIVRVEAWAQ